MRISLSLVDGVSTFIERGRSIEKRIPQRAMLTIAHRLYHNGWVMSQEVSGDTVTRIIMMNPIMVIGG